MSLKLNMHPMYTAFSVAEFEAASEDAYVAGHNPQTCKSASGALQWAQKAKSLATLAASRTSFQMAVSRAGRSKLDGSVKAAPPAPAAKASQPSSSVYGDALRPTRQHSAAHCPGQHWASSQGGSFERGGEQGWGVFTR